jgi:hypothetical protein
MKLLVITLAFSIGLLAFSANQVFVIPVIQENMKVHLLADHDANHLNTDFGIWGPPGTLGLSASLGNNAALLSDFLTPQLSSYKIEAQQAMGVVVEYEGPDGDLNLVAIRGSSAIIGFIISHMGSNPNWQNRFAFGADVDNIFSYEMGDGQSESRPYYSMDAMVYEFSSFTVHRGKGFCSVMCANQGFQGGGFFEFTRQDGIRGSAAVSPTLYRMGKPGNTKLYMTHIAKDTTHFWTGYSLLNMAGERADVTMSAWKNGGIIATESFSILYYEQNIAVIGSERFAGLSPSEIDWIEINSNVPLLGLELFGSPSSQNSYLAGFELPTKDMVSQKMLFPAVSNEPSRWTGLCVLNPSADTAVVTVYFISGQMDDPNTLNCENVLGFSEITIGRGQKWISEISSLTTPEILEQTRGITVVGTQNLLGFALIGDQDRQQLGGYLGIPVPFID